jgi:hypothetical protein
MSRSIIIIIITTRIVTAFNSGSGRDDRRVRNDGAIKVEKDGQPGNEPANLT